MGSIHKWHITLLLIISLECPACAQMLSSGREDLRPVAQTVCKPIGGELSPYSSSTKAQIRDLSNVVDSELVRIRKIPCHSPGMVGRKYKECHPDTEEQEAAMAERLKERISRIENSLDLCDTVGAAAAIQSLNSSPELGKFSGLTSRLTMLMESPTARNIFELATTEEPGSIWFRVPESSLLRNIDKLAILEDTARTQQGSVQDDEIRDRKKELGLALQGLAPFSATKSEIQLDAIRLRSGGTVETTNALSQQLAEVNAELSAATDLISVLESETCQKLINRWFGPSMVNQLHEKGAELPKYFQLRTSLRANIQRAKETERIERRKEYSCLSRGPFTPAMKRRAAFALSLTDRADNKQQIIFVAAGNNCDMLAGYAVINFPDMDGNFYRHVFPNYSAESAQFARTLYEQGFRFYGFTSHTTMTGYLVSAHGWVGLNVANPRPGDLTTLSDATTWMSDHSWYWRP